MMLGPGLGLAEAPNEKSENTLQNQKSAEHLSKFCDPPTFLNEEQRMWEATSQPGTEEAFNINLVASF